jgi:hypothetical protein
MSLLVPITPTAVNVGRNTGGSTNTVSIGTDAASGTTAQGSQAVAVGYNSGKAGGQSSVSIGDSATATSAHGVAIGYNASVISSAASIAIGAYASVSAVEQAIVINGTDTVLAPPANHTFVVHPVGLRTVNTGLLPLYYDLSTNEIVAYNVNGVIYRISYSANGGTGSVPFQDEAGGTVIVLNNALGLIPPVGKIFTSWNSKQNGSGSAYPASSQFTVTKTQTLYATWV